MSDKEFSESQKQYLSGFTYGADVARAVRKLPILSGAANAGSTVAIGGGNRVDKQAVQAPSSPEQAAYEAQQRVIASGKKLSREELAKQKKNPLDLWGEISHRAQQNVFPKGDDVFLTKFQGLFFVAPAQNAFMCRMRIPGGELHAYQLEGIADLSEVSAGDYIDVTTRANLQLREIPANQGMNILYGLRELGVVCLGSGGDNIRNVTASPLSGIDPDELIETLPIAKRMHHYILNHREMYGLPRKFNIAFDGGGRISALDDTNDIGFHAVRVPEAHADQRTPMGIYFQLTLGGITGHSDFARDTGVLVTPDEALEVAGAIVRVFLENGDRTDRKRARLKYVLDEWGFEKFLTEVEKSLGKELRRVDRTRWERPEIEDRLAHIDVHAQAQTGKNYIGIVLPVGRMTADQARGLARLSRRFGSGRVRLTVWQNLLLTDIADDDLPEVQQSIRKLGLDYAASNLRAGLVACTGSAGCKFAGADTKRHAMQVAEYLEEWLTLDTPINIHVTGCHHSCAQHYIGDIGMIATKVEVGDDMVEGYHVHVGGGWGKDQGIGQLLFTGVPADEVAPLLRGLLTAYLQQRGSKEEFFVQFVNRKSVAELREMTKACALL
ncbi:NirA family protein [Aureliella helgolandensis]|uniref:Sulfite reductase [ferredoxin] n=1 Tax=Aureliella helgolandensis TaxID=2527968 RepID=A0A518GGV5_9BACT|nr:NirA family protein [Aureliella helgolandensis]QDV27788.1 Sulfite reductase [ferredoxin] [Aureliella helgolandensis]